MNRNTDEYLPGILNGATAVGVMLVSFLIDLHLPMSKEVAKPVGMAVVAAGMAVALWATAHIKAAVLGEVEPRLDRLVQSGPYRFVRHPIYLGMTIALVGAALALRSWPGMLGALLLFLPSEIYRARLEERALSRRFGSEWKDYAARTGFILPRVGR
jgi:protein-S-isoprenylcysteine O-methyltransferase Ste14